MNIEVPTYGRPMQSKEVVIEDRNHPHYRDLKARYEALSLRPQTQVLFFKNPIISETDGKPKIFYNASPKVVSSERENGEIIKKIQFLGRLESVSVEDSVFATAVAEHGQLVDIHPQGIATSEHGDIKREDPYNVNLNGDDYTISVKAWPYQEKPGDTVFHSEIAKSDDLNNPIGQTPDFVKGLRVIPAKGLRINSQDADGIAGDGFIVYFRTKHEMGVLTIDGVSKNVSESEIRRIYVKNISDIQPERLNEALKDETTLLLKTKETWGGLGVNLIGKNQEEIFIGHMGMPLNNGITGAREYGITTFVKDPSNGATRMHMILEEQDFERNYEKQTGMLLEAKRLDLKPIVFPTGVIFVKTQNGYDTLITAGINDLYQGVAKVDFPFIDMVDFDNPYNQQFVVDESVAQEAFPDIYPVKMDAKVHPIEAETLQRRYVRVNQLDYKNGLYTEIFYNEPISTA